MMAAVSRQLSAISYQLSAISRQLKDRINSVWLSATAKRECLKLTADS
jgi:hypothetical protein